MDRMWAPWRMTYILGGDDAGTCIFCSYPAAGAAHYEEHQILCVTPHAFAIMNRYPYNNGHLMVVPRRHMASLRSTVRPRASRNQTPCGVACSSCCRTPSPNVLDMAATWQSSPERAAAARTLRPSSGRRTAAPLPTCTASRAHLAARRHDAARALWHGTGTPCPGKSQVT